MITSFLEIRILASLKMFVHLLLIPAILDAKADNLLGYLCVCKIQSRYAVEFNILSKEVLSSIKHFTPHIENLHTKSTWLKDTVIEAWIPWFGAVTHSNRKFTRFGEKLCLSKMKRQLSNNKFPFVEPSAHIPIFDFGEQSGIPFMKDSDLPVTKRAANYL